MMDKLKLISLLVIIFYSVHLAQEEWEWLNPKPHGNSITEVRYLDSNSIITFAFNGLISISKDQGVSWINEKMNDNLWINSVSYINPNNMWATGINFSKGEGQILKSNDNGKSWELQYSEFGKAFLSIHFVNSNCGWVVGPNGIIMNSIDGGQSWNNNSINITDQLESVYFISDSVGWVVGWNGTVLYTEAQDTLWEKFNIGASEILNDVFFINDEIGWIVEGGYDSGKIFKTIDGGLNWTQQNVNSDGRLNSVKFLDTNIGWVKTDYELLTTKDGGNEWQSILTSNDSEEFNDFDFQDRNNGIVVGHGGAFYRTEDGGNTWVNCYDKLDFRIIDICFVNSQIAFGVGKKTLADYSAETVLMHSDNGGISWDTKVIPEIEYPYSLFFLDQNLGWLKGEDSVLYKTEDGGKSWTYQNTRTDISFKDIFFLDENIGWGFSDKLIKKTIDGGNNWTTKWNSTNYQPPYISEMEIIDKDIALFIGPQMILKTVDGGNNWDTTACEQWLESIDFLDDSNGFIVGQGGSILKTKNGGVTWEIKESFSDRSLYSCIFINENIIYAFGDDGYIRKSIDGGEKWSSYQSICQWSLTNSYSTSDGKIWAWGDKNAIIYKDLKITNIFNPGIITTRKEFILLNQNYPNPFNPETTIRYSIPVGVNSESTIVNLVVYDILGREVVTLVNENQKPGNYEVEFSAEGGSGMGGDFTELSSGIYFYRLRTGDYVETKKMLLLK